MGVAGSILRQLGQMPWCHVTVWPPLAGGVQLWNCGSALGAVATAPLAEHHQEVMNINAMAILIDISDAIADALAPVLEDDEQVIQVDLPRQVDVAGATVLGV